MTNIINTGKITDIRKLKTPQDLWAYQPKRVQLAIVNARDIAAEACTMAMEAGVSAEKRKMLAAIYWAALYGRLGWSDRFPGRPIHLRKAVRLLGLDRRAEGEIHLLASSLWVSKRELETFRMMWPTFYGKAYKTALEHIRTARRKGDAA